MITNVEIETLYDEEIANLCTVSSIPKDVI